MNEYLTNNKIIMYGTKTCPMVPPIKGIFRRTNVEYDYIDIGRDTPGKEFVRSVNNGYESVPTIVFPDGTTMTEPSGKDVKEKLLTMGYQINPPKPWDALRENPFYALLGIAGLLFGIIDGNNVFVGLGLGFIVITFIISYTQR